METTETIAIAPESLQSAAIDELQRMLDSRNFPASGRLRQLLKYLVDSALAGRQHLLNQRSLANEVFGRGDDFDPEQDAIVRVEMAKLRRAIAHYYDTAPGVHIVHISIPKGSYVPSFEQLMDIPASPDKPAEPQPADMLPARPSLCVRSFRCLSDDCEASRIADSLTDELEVTLSQLPYLKIVSHPATAPDENLTGGYLLEGTVKRANSQLRVNSRLLDLDKDEVIWTERIEHNLDTTNIFELQDDIVHTITAHTADVYSGIINRSLMNTLDTAGTNRFSSWQATLSFYRYLTRHSDESYRLAREALEDASPREPENPLLLAMLADLRRAGYSVGYTDEADPLPGVLELAQRAVALAPDSATCRLALCYALLQARNKTELLEVAEPLLENSLTSPCYRGDAAIAVALSGEWRRGCEVIEDTLPRLTSAPHMFLYPLFLDAYRGRDYDSALKIAGRFRPAPVFWQPVFKAVALAQTGERSRAARCVDELLLRRPAFPRLGRRWLSCFIMEDDLVDQLMDGLRKAGLGYA